MIPSSCIRKSRRIPLGFNKKPEKSRPASMRLRKAGLSGFPVISYLQNRSISPKRPFFHNRKPMQKGDIAAVQRDPKDKTLRLQAAGGTIVFSHTQSQRRPYDPSFVSLTEKKENTQTYILGCKSGCYPCNSLTISLVCGELGIRTPGTT